MAIVEMTAPAASLAAVLHRVIQTAVDDGGLTPRDVAQAIQALVQANDDVQREMQEA